MKYHFIKYSLVVASLFILNGCLVSRTDLRGDTDSGKVQQEQTQAQAQAAKRAEIVHADEYDEQMRRMNGRIEVLESQLQQAQANNQSEQENKKKLKDDWERRQVAFEEAIKKLELQVTQLNEELQSVRKQQNAKPETAAKSSFETASQAFDKKNWKEAIVGFQKYRELNPKGSHMAEASYKIGVSFLELNMKDEAKTFFDDVVAKYPKSKEAKKATSRLKNLK